MWSLSQEATLSQLSEREIEDLSSIQSIPECLSQVVSISNQPVANDPLLFLQAGGKNFLLFLNKIQTARLEALRQSSRSLLSQESVQISSQLSNDILSQEPLINYFESDKGNGYYKDKIRAYKLIAIYLIWESELLKMQAFPSSQQDENQMQVISSNIEFIKSQIDQDDYAELLATDPLVESEFENEPITSQKKDSKAYQAQRKNQLTIDLAALGISQSYAADGRIKATTIETSYTFYPWPNRTSRHCIFQTYLKSSRQGNSYPYGWIDWETYNTLSEALCTKSVNISQCTLCEESFNKAGEIHKHFAKCLRDKKFVVEFHCPNKECKKSASRTSNLRQKCDCIPKKCTKPTQRGRRAVQGAEAADEDEEQVEEQKEEQEDEQAE